jgi:molybdate transport system substrate-binding protein
MAHRLIATLVFAAASFVLPCEAAQVRVFLSGGFAAAYEELVQDFMRQSGHNVETARGPSMGETPQAIPNRMARGEPVDVVIMVREALDGLAAGGKVVADSRLDLARSSIAMAVKSGTPKPDISTMDAFRKTLLGAKSIAYSDSASGVYLSTVLFPRMGIVDAIRDKSRMIPAEPVGKVVARGEAEIGFQQLSELKHVNDGIDIVGLIPGEAQKVTIFSAGIAAAAKEPLAARQLLDFLGSRGARGTIAKSGLEPIDR